MLLLIRSVKFFVRFSEKVRVRNSFRLNRVRLLFLACSR